MNMTERTAHLATLAGLPTDAERLAAYQALHAIEMAALQRVVIMCTCEDWLNCAHPWPGRLEDSGLKMVDATGRVRILNT